MNNRVQLFLILFLLGYQMHGQDLIFSQYFASQPYLNPAMTGFFDGSYRVNAQVRNQWQGIAGGINSYGLNADYKFGDNDPEKDYFAVGVCAYQDQIFKLINYTTVRVNASFTKRLGEPLSFAVAGQGRLSIFHQFHLFKRHSNYYYFLSDLRSFDLNFRFWNEQVFH